MLHREADKGTGFELGQEVAALIQGATLIPLPGSTVICSTTATGRWSWMRLLGFLCEPESTGGRG